LLFQRHSAHINKTAGALTAAQVRKNRTRKQTRAGFTKHHFATVNNILPRQARDKHTGKALKKEHCLRRLRTAIMLAQPEVTRVLLSSAASRCPEPVLADIRLLPTRWRPKPRLFEPLIYKNEHFTKTGSGQT